MLAVLGTGPQAHAHVRLVTVVRPFREIRLAGRDPAEVAAPTRDLDASGFAVRPCTIDAAVEGADVVCAATSTVDPLAAAG